MPAAKEIFFVIVFIRTRRGINNKLMKGKMANETPAAVEAPFPPRKPAKTGQL